MASIPLVGHWLNAGYIREMEARKRRYAANDYYRNGRFDLELKRRDERKIIAQTNRDFVNAAKSRSFAYAGGQIVGQQPVFMAEMAMKTGCWPTIWPTA